MITFDVENSAFQSSRIENTVVLKYKENAFSLLQDIAIRDEYLELVKAIDETAKIKGSVVINDTEFDDEAGIKALLEFVGSREDSRASTSFLSEIAIDKFRNSFGSRMLSYITMAKPQVAGVHGDVTGEYLGLILPNDTRFATPEARFVFSNASWGLPVSPGLSCFLPRFIGQGKALDFIHHSKILTAEEALSLGLITDIVHRDQLQARCIKEVEMLSSQPADVAAANRSLLNPSISEFEIHLGRYYTAMGRSFVKLLYCTKK